MFQCSFTCNKNECNLIVSMHYVEIANWSSVEKSQSDSSLSAAVEKRRKDARSEFFNSTDPCEKYFLFFLLLCVNCNSPHPLSSSFLLFVVAVSFRPQCWFAQFAR